MRVQFWHADIPEDASISVRTEVRDSYTGNPSAPLDLGQTVANGTAGTWPAGRYMQVGRPEQMSRAALQAADPAASHGENARTQHVAVWHVGGCFVQMR
jgi:hypothetical protein